MDEWDTFDPTAALGSPASQDDDAQQDDAGSASPASAAPQHAAAVVHAPVAAAAAVVHAPVPFVPPALREGIAYHNGIAVTIQPTGVVSATRGMLQDNTWSMVHLVGLRVWADNGTTVYCGWNGECPQSFGRESEWAAHVLTDHIFPGVELRVPRTNLPAVETAEGPTALRGNSRVWKCMSGAIDDDGAPLATYAAGPPPPLADLCTFAFNSALDLLAHCYEKHLISTIGTNSPFSCFCCVNSMYSFHQLQEHCYVSGDRKATQKNSRSSFCHVCRAPDSNNNAHRNAAPGGCARRLRNGVYVRGNLPQDARLSTKPPRSSLEKDLEFHLETDAAFANAIARQVVAAAGAPSPVNLPLNVAAAVQSPVNLPADAAAAVPSPLNLPLDASGAMADLDAHPQALAQDLPAFGLDDTVMPSLPMDNLRLTPTVAYGDAIRVHRNVHGALAVEVVRPRKPGVWAVGVPLQFTDRLLYLCGWQGRCQMLFTGQVPWMAHVADDHLLGLPNMAAQHAIAQATAAGVPGIVKLSETHKSLCPLCQTPVGTAHQVAKHLVESHTWTWKRDKDAVPAADVRGVGGAARLLPVLSRQVFRLCYTCGDAFTSQKTLVIHIRGANKTNSDLRIKPRNGRKVPADVEARDRQTCHTCRLRLVQPTGVVVTHLTDAPAHCHNELLGNCLFLSGPAPPGAPARRRVTVRQLDAIDTALAGPDVPEGTKLTEALTPAQIERRRAITALAV